MSGAVAANGAWPANARPATSVNERRIANGRAMSVLFSRFSFALRRRRCTRWQRIAEREVHDHDLLLLLDDDLLGEPLQSLVLAVAQLRYCHVDGSLVVWDHHPGEVSVRIAGEGDVHLHVHAGDRVANHRLEPIAADGLAMLVLGGRSDCESQDHTQ